MLLLPDVAVLTPKKNLEFAHGLEVVLSSNLINDQSRDIPLKVLRPLHEAFFVTLNMNIHVFDLFCSDLSYAHGHASTLQSNEASYGLATG